MNLDSCSLGNLVPKRTGKRRFARAHVAGKNEERRARMEVVESGELAAVVLLVPLAKQPRINQQKCLFDETIFVFVKADESVKVGRAARVGKVNNVLEEIDVVQDTPPSTARRTPPAPEM